MRKGRKGGNKWNGEQVKQVTVEKKCKPEKKENTHTNAGGGGRSAEKNKCNTNKGRTNLKKQVKKQQPSEKKALAAARPQGPQGRKDRKDKERSRAKGKNSGREKEAKNNSSKQEAKGRKMTIVSETRAGKTRREMRRGIKAQDQEAQECRSER